MPRRTVTIDLPEDAPIDERGKPNILRGVAILRVDTPVPKDHPEYAFSLKKIVFSNTEADSEIERLNRVNRGKCLYFSQLARIQLPAGRETPRGKVSK